jgi:hypothetical protein
MDNEELKVEAGYQTRSDDEHYGDRRIGNIMEFVKTLV